ncbi:hypothetical protein [Paenibacillus macquariensis]|uniref:Uncharacterized protein n=1 Tax=Paenibacillus macquariensis TaxID=948756 RepID=A0ABY1JS22_9BACL|nr:hypothetical protein [Paenibacillus macquariensis]MEC0092853.1 hypothetical protein [Paenibacillus macquariensis]SIQ67566.1 hypothetical protein SAMN05421578_103308 [Paenibacillus macquariensis]
MVTNPTKTGSKIIRMGSEGNMVKIPVFKRVYIDKNKKLIGEQEGTGYLFLIADYGKEK